MGKINTIGENVFRQIFDSTIEGILIAEMEEKTFIYANKVICDMFGYNYEEMISLSVADIHPKDSLENVIKTFSAQTRGEFVLAKEIPCQRKNGTIFWADINAKKVIIHNVPCNVGFFSDVTDRRSAEREVDASQRLLSSVFDAVPDLLIVIDRSFKIRYTNFKGHDLIKPTDTEKAKTCYGRFKLLDVPCDDCSAYPVFNSGEIVEREMINPADGRTREVRAFPIKDVSGKVIYVVEYVRDITDKKQAENDRIKLEQQILQNQKLESLGVLAGGIAHDFNNLLSGIYGFIDLAREAASESEVHKYLDSALQTMSRTRSLTQQLLTFAKGGTPIKVVTRLNQFIKDTVDFALSGSSITCLYEIESSLWPCDIDKEQIGQVFDNIVINAKQAMPLGGIIQVTAKNIILDEGQHTSLSVGKYVQITIRDSGIGISQDIINRVYDPFFTTKQTGSGLGLATSYSIIKKHDGHIDVESVVEKGTTFYIFLPSSDTNEIAKSNETKTEAQKTGTILIMDDEKVVRDTMSHMLSKAGYETVVTKEGSEALRLFRERIASKNQFSAAILDLTIRGGMNGKVTLDEIRKHDKNIPVIVSSGYAEDPIIQNPTAYGFTDSIKKPFYKKELVSMLVKYL